ncbi:MAG: GNAT family N-acetyltransferase [Leptospira sp.]|nr:GNAT family N-acetyltransferase [Leptospira sp.]
MTNTNPSEHSFLFERTSNPDETTQTFLWNQLKDYSRSKIGRADHESSDFFSIILREGEKIIAGALCYSYFKAVNLQLLWVDESKRGQKIGSLLLSKIEEEANQLDANLIFLYSFEFQAPKFYLKFGYKQFGMIEQFPEGYNCYFLQKRLR